MPILTCENHTHLFWMCKKEAVSDDGRYTGARNIFFIGRELREGESPCYPGNQYTEWAFPRSDDRLLHECACPGSALICVDMNGGN